MIITLSPAKLMNFGTAYQMESTTPLFVSQRDEVIGVLQSLLPEDVMKLMKINRKQADEVISYLQTFHHEQSQRGASALVYNGIAYKGLDFASLLPTEVAFAQRHLLIGSAVYGWLRPLDEVRPYRLEMEAKLSNSCGKDLYAFWKEELTNYLNLRLVEKGRVWLNLMSAEYSKVVDARRLPAGTLKITPQFLEETPQGFRQVVVHTKKARGLMARFVIQHEITSSSDLQAFDIEGYHYVPHLSSLEEPVFAR